MKKLLFLSSVAFFSYGVGKMILNKYREEKAKGTLYKAFGGLGAARSFDASHYSHQDCDDSDWIAMYI